VSDLEADRALMARLPRTWPAFFSQHGNFTAIQLAAIPPILGGANVLISSPTASGKTEAALSPLIENYCQPHAEGLRLLYITPTRALAGDLLKRLAFPLQQLHLTCAVKTRDLNTFSIKRPAALLITTPESVDSLLASSAGVFSTLRGIILDEIHLFDGTPRGDQLRVLFDRIRAIRAYAARQGDAEEAHIQFVALSATVDDASALASRYFPDVLVESVPGGRAIQAEILPLDSENAEELRDFLQTFSRRGWRKALAFCNSRAEVEQYAEAVRRSSPFGHAVYTHYSNIAPDRRRRVEQRFDQDEAAICFASSTLELGIDIGSIDVIILIGPPGDARSFIQRLGRGNRRKGTIQAACFYRSPLEEVLFQVLLALAEQGIVEEKTAAFRPSVAVQQILSLLKQSSTAAIRLNSLTPLFDGLIAHEELSDIVGHLEFLDYLKPGRPGEWQAGVRLNQLVDDQAKPDAPLSLYSNIQIEPTRLEVRDQNTRQTIARISVRERGRTTLTLEGRPLSVRWADGEALWVTAQAEGDTAEKPVFRSSRPILSYQVACQLPILLGLESNTTPFVEAPDGGWWCFHWLGDLYGRILFELVRPHLLVKVSPHSGLCLWFASEPGALPAWTEAQIESYLMDHYQRIEAWLDLGAFYRHLPSHLRQRAVVDQVNPEKFAAILAGHHPILCPPHRGVDLIRLVEKERLR
jgi:ATP-dependent Lhr-like helicase